MALSKITNQQIDSSGLPSGSIIQTIQNKSGDQFAPTSGAATWQDSGYTVTITPTSANNKVLVSLVCFGIVRNPGVVGIKLLRGTTEIWETDGYSSDATYWQTTNFSFTFLDLPATTSATTYKVQMYSGNLTSALQQTRINYHSGTSGFDPQALMIAQEIVG